MKITILCTSPEHPVNAWLERWIDANGAEHEISLLRRRDELVGGDILFLISCSEIINAAHRMMFGRTLVIHASDLPQGRGWSPHIWQIAGGAPYITVTLLEAEDKVDSGAVWRKQRLDIAPHWLSDEIHAALFDTELSLMDFAVSQFGAIIPQAQPDNVAPSYYEKRTPENSRIDPHRPLADQFDLIRVCDPDRYPAFFELHGQRYKIKLEKF